MNVSDEAQVLRCFELALDQPAGRRVQWLVEQRLPPWLHDRVQRLIEAESRLEDGFLAGPAVAIEPAPVFPKEGDRIGNYELLSEIDSGGMGVVHLGRRADRAYELQVAIKLIRPIHMGAAPEFRRRLIERFENERALLARLNHRNIARILDGGTTETGIPYLVMEYVDGRSLLRYCEEQQLDVRARVQLFRQVCAGVQEAHRHLIVHRDLKPDNILVDARGEPRLLDFGIARTLEEHDESHAATMLTLMTPAYASPEQVRRDALTTSSDVYSLGVVLYELLSGVRPYDLRDLTPAQAERMVHEAQPLPLREAVSKSKLDTGDRLARVSQLRPDLDRIIAKAMHKEPSRRYSSAQELSEDLSRFLDGRPVLAHPDSAWYRISRFVSRNRTGSAVATLALLLVMTATAAALWQARQATRAARDAAAMNTFLLDVLQMSDPFDAGSELTLSQALDEAAKLIDERFAGRPDLSAQIRFGIGYSMVSRYRLEAAESQLTRALADSASEFGRNDIRTLRALEGMAGLRQEQGQPRVAEALFKEGIARVEAASLTSDPLYFNLLGNLGNLYLTEEKYELARVQFERALQAESRAGASTSTLDHANLLSNLAHTEHGLGHLDQADALYRRAQAALQTLYPDGNPDLAILLNNRALLTEDRGHEAEALELHKQSLSMRRRVFGAEHPMIVVAMANVARLSVHLAEPSSVLQLARDAAAMADRVYKDPIPRHASVHVTLADVKLANGDVAGAVATWLRAKELLEAVESKPPATVNYLERVRVGICKQWQGELCQQK